MALKLFEFPERIIIGMCFDDLIMLANRERDNN